MAFYTRLNYNNPCENFSHRKHHTIVLFAYFTRKLGKQEDNNMKFLFNRNSNENAEDQKTELSIGETLNEQELKDITGGYYGHHYDDYYDWYDDYDDDYSPRDFNIQSFNVQNFNSF